MIYGLIGIVLPLMIKSAIERFAPEKNELRVIKSSEWCHYWGLFGSTPAPVDTNENKPSINTEEVSN